MISHSEVASVLNAARSNTQTHRIPQFIIRNKEQIKFVSKILEKGGIAVAAVGGVLHLKEAFSNDKKNVNDEVVDIIMKAAVNATIATTVMTTATTTTSTEPTTKMSFEIFNPIGGNK